MRTCAGRGCFIRFKPYNGLQSYCSATCRYREKARRNRASNPTRHRVNQRNARYIRNFGITTDDYERMLMAQNGRCFVCGRPPGKTRLAVDHNHQTGVVRGLLCMPCNRHVGWYEAFGSGVRRYLAED